MKTLETRESDKKADFSSLPFFGHDGVNQYERYDEGDDSLVRGDFRGRLEGRRIFEDEWRV